MAARVKRTTKPRKSSARGPTVNNQDSDLGDSWIVDEHASDDDEYLNSDSSEEEIQAQADTPSPVFTRRKIPTRVHTGTAESAIFPGRADPGSELRMPVIDHSSPNKQVRQRKQSTKQTSKSSVKPPGFRQTHARQAGADVGSTALHFAKQVAVYLLDLLGMVLNNLKTPLAFLVSVYLVVGCLIIAGNFLTQGIYSAVSPICRVPGVSLLSLPFCDNTAAAKYGTEPPPPEFDRLMESQSKFEDILSSSTVGVTLPADMKRSEAAIRDLRTLVRYSSLKSRNELALEFDGFIETARMAAADLQKFNSRTGRAADTIISTARWTMRTLDDVNAEQAARGGVAAFISDTVLAPFQPAKMTPALLLDQYVAHTRKVEDEINHLLEQAQALLLILNNLEERLDIMHDISVRDGTIANVAREELLGKLWTILGGNKSELRKYNSQLDLLQHVGKYRQSAWAHISTTVLKLQAMNAELEELRERVGSTELLQDRKDLPLSVHLDAIQMGVERLEIGRKSMRDAEMNYYNKAIQDGRPGAEPGVVEGKLIGT